MIHQFIFAGPKPGLSAEAFNSYWRNFHAVEFAAKIKQIRQYLISTRLPVATSSPAPFFEGVAEIWLANDAEQLASLQSPEFLQGARLDEPRWAAFWRTFVLDTDPEVLSDYSGSHPWPEFSKLYILVKRKPGVPLQLFRDDLLRDRTPLASQHDLARHLIGFARTGLYGFGEPAFDAIEVLSFRTPEQLTKLVAAGAGAGAVLTAHGDYCDDKQTFQFPGQEHWVIRPGER
jgi:hypothetical protein